MSTIIKVKRSKIVKDKHLKFLDDLRESGQINMLGSGPSLIKEFGLSKPDAREVLLYWMESFEERHPIKEGAV